MGAHLDDATIAEVLNCSSGTVRTHAKRALDSLRKGQGRRNRPDDKTLTMTAGYRAVDVILDGYAGDDGVLVLNGYRASPRTR